MVELLMIFYFVGWAYAMYLLTQRNVEQGRESKSLVAILGLGSWLSVIILTLIKKRGMGKLQIGQEYEVLVSDGKYEKLKLVDIHPHQDIKDAVYYEFDNGLVERDVRLKLKSW